MIKKVLVYRRIFAEDDFCDNARCDFANYLFHEDGHSLPICLLEDEITTRVKVGLSYLRTDGCLKAQKRFEEEEGQA